MLLRAAAGGAPGGDGDGEEETGDAGAGLPVKAAVRVRIPLKRPEPGDDGGRSEVSQGPKSKRSSHKGDPEDAPLEEVDLADHVLAVPTHGDSYRIYVVH